MFAVDFSISVKPLLLPQSVHDPVALVTTSSVTPVILTWDFGDLSPRLNTTGTGLTTESHKYGLPGHYTVTVVARAGNKEVKEDIYFFFFLMHCRIVFFPNHHFNMYTSIIHVIQLLYSCSGLRSDRSDSDSSSQTGTALPVSCCGQ